MIAFAVTPFVAMRTHGVILLLAALALPDLRGQVGDRAEIDRSAPPAHWEVPGSKVRTPAETIALFDLPAGFRVEVVAAEPLVQDPIAIQFDERGRLWVLEWPAYNWKLRDVIPGLEKQEPPKARVVILEDTDGDGRMDRRTVFLDGFEWPRGLQVMRDGALVLRLPEMVFARDTNGDGKSDRQEILVNGLEIPANPHGAQSNLLRAMDNWVYGSKFPQRMREADGRWVSQPGLSMRGQWGLSQDNHGRFVYASNGDHLRGDLVPGHYFTRNPNHGATAGVDIRYPADQYVWPHQATPGVNRRGQLRDENGTLRVFTANTGPTVYRGDQFPPGFVGNVFLGEVAGRFIRRSILTETDGAITARNAYDRREFLFSKDERFRPVFTANGPDGALYVADMHRGIIEGDIFVTSFLRNQIVDRRLQQPFHGMGRVYRIVHESRPRRAGPRLDRSNAAGWVEHLAHPNGFWRDTAQRLIVESGDRRVLPALRKMAGGHSDELARLHALWTVEGLGGVDAELVARALRDASAKVRVAALRLSEPLLSDASFARRVIALEEDPRLEVRRQLLFTLGEMKSGEGQQAMLRLAGRDLEQPVTLEATLSGLHGRESAVLGQLVDDPAWREERPGAGRLIGALAQAVVNSGSKEVLEPLIRLAADAAGKPQWMRLAVLDGLKGAEKKPAMFPAAAVADLEKSVDEGVRSRAVALKESWTSAAPAGARPARALTGPVLERGRFVFAICAPCHGPEGKGLPELAPPLEGSTVVAGPAEEVLRSVLNGRNLDRANKRFPDMPSLGGLPDEDIAAVVSYVRARWGGATRLITIGQVAQARRSSPTAVAAPVPTVEQPGAR